MDPAAYALMAETEDRHWWWSGRRAILRQVLRDLFADPAMPRGPLFDLGCGVGSNLALLGEFGEAIGYDGSPAAVGYAHARGRMGVHLADLAAEPGAVLQAHGPGTASVVLMADVLEHLDDERPALDLAHALLAPGGCLIATVPAHRWLWGPADVFNHHRRRYTRATLSDAVAPVFAIERLTHFNVYLLPAIATARALARALRRPGAQEVGLPPRPINAALAALFASETVLLGRGDIPVGVSLLCVARKARGVAPRA